MKKTATEKKKMATDLSPEALLEALRALYPDAETKAEMTRRFSADAGIAPFTVKAALLGRWTKPTVPLRNFLGVLLRQRHKKDVAERLGL